MSLKLAFYEDCFCRIRRNKYAGKFINAKPCLLLSIIIGINSDKYSSNMFIYDECLKRIYENTWEKYVENNQITPMYKPFYHLASDNFWHLKWETVPRKVLTITNKFILDNISYAFFDEDLWQLLQEKEIREIMNNKLISLITDNR